MASKWQNLFELLAEVEPSHLSSGACGLATIGVLSCLARGGLRKGPSRGVRGCEGHREGGHLGRPGGFVQAWPLRGG